MLGGVGRQRTETRRYLGPGEAELGDMCLAELGSTRVFHSFGAGAAPKRDRPSMRPLLAEVGQQWADALCEGHMPNRSAWTFSEGPRFSPTWAAELAAREQQSASEG